MKILIFLLISILFIYSCSKEQPTQQNNVEKYQLVLNDSYWTEVTDTIIVRIKTKNYSYFSELVPTIIDDSITYQNQLNTEGSVLPYIDFGTRTLIGSKTFTGFASFNYQVFKKNIDNKYKFIINEIPKDSVWQKLIRLTGLHFVAIPKINEGSTFEIIYLINGQ